MHDRLRIIKRIIIFLGFVRAKIIFDCFIYKITKMSYPNVIFWESVIVFFFLLCRYSKKHKVQKENSGSSDYLDDPLLKAIQSKVSNSIFVDFVKSNKTLLVLLFLSNASALQIVKFLKTIFLFFLNDNIFYNDDVAGIFLPIAIKLTEHQGLVNFVYSFYFCTIVYIFLIKIDFPPKK